MVKICNTPYPSNSKYETHFELYPYPLSDFQKYAIEAIVEKPQPDKAPSTLGVVGRYVLNPGIFTELQETPRGAGGEIQLTDAISTFLKKEAVHAYRFEGRRFDCGSKIGFLEATLRLALERPNLAPELKEILRELHAADYL